MRRLIVNALGFMEDACWHYFHVFRCAKENREAQWGVTSRRYFLNRSMDDF